MIREGEGRKEIGKEGVEKEGRKGGGKGEVGMGGSRCRWMATLASPSLASCNVFHRFAPPSSQLPSYMLLVSLLLLSESSSFNVDAHMHLRLSSGDGSVEVLCSRCWLFQY